METGNERNREVTVVGGKEGEKLFGSIHAPSQQISCCCDRWAGYLIATTQTLPKLPEKEQKQAGAFISLWDLNMKSWKEQRY